MLKPAAAAVAIAVVLPVSGPRRFDTPDISLFFVAAGQEQRQAREALDTIAAGWRDGYVAMIVDLVRLMRPIRSSGLSESVAPPEAPPADEDDRSIARETDPDRLGGRPIRWPPARNRLLRFLEKQTGQRLGTDLARWREWMWGLPYDAHPDYASFKGLLYRTIDERMAAFFPAGVRHAIRLDEIDWGGVAVNGIPPLDHPKHIDASGASYLRGGNIVFGVFINGEARAYPKRILAWHELARDRVGGVDVTVVYCTLCGTAIPYESIVGGRRRTFGTSGLLYRSNKLMFDEESRSLWSTLEGRPVVGPLVGTGLQLKAHPMVTTTWEDWRSQHPQTRVLSLETGYDRDYSEGAAYREYFASDRLMFMVPRIDRRLKNKAPVLVMVLRGADASTRHPIAISTAFLQKRPLYQAKLGGRDLLVVTTPGGASRVYEAGSIRMVRLAGAGVLEDIEGNRWNIAEDAVVREGHPGPALPRVAAQQAFWFGWYAQFPDTELVK